ncbi:hypothetical protein BDF14DRAFT_320336 [Spinellus fusiger]|nr:hypothetical protein BDF14DRAFT_320336 [Spinellus fusiger]
MDSRHIVIVIELEGTKIQHTINWVMSHLLRTSDSIHLVTVIVDTDAELSDELVAFDKQEFAELEEETAAKYILAVNSATRQLASNGYYNVQGHIIKSNSSEITQDIVYYTETQKVDCLVMGSRRLSGWKRFFVGSFSDQVQSQVTCPVLIVK